MVHSRHVCNMTDQGSKDIVILCIGDKRIPCEKQCLMRNSSYFNAMFTSQMKEAKASEVELKETSPDVVATLIGVTCDEAESLSQLDDFSNLVNCLQGAAMFQFEKVQQYCVQRLHKILCSSNCVSVLCVADMLSLNTLYRRSMAFALYNFWQVVSPQDINDWPLHLLKDYLSNTSLCVGETEIFLAVLRWVDADQSHREKLFHLIRCVRLGLLHPDTVRNIILEEHRVMSDEHTRTLISNVLSVNIPVAELSTSCSELDGEICVICGDIPVNKDGGDGDSKEGSSSKKGRHEETGESSAGAVQKGEGGDDQKSSQGKRSPSKRKGSRTDICAACFPMWQPRQPKESIVIGGGELMTVKTFPDHVEKNSEVFKSICFLSPDNEKMSDRLTEIANLDDIAALEDGHRYDDAVGFRVIGQGKDIFVIGGEIGLGRGRWLKQIWKYDVLSRQWSKGPQLMSARRHHAAVSLQDTDIIIICGGFGQYREILNTVERFDTKNDVMVRCRNMVRAEYSPSICSHGSQSVFVIKQCVQHYNVVTDQWTMLSDDLRPLQESHDMMSVSSVMFSNNSLYVCGGHDCHVVSKWRVVTGGSSGTGGTGTSGTGGTSTSGTGGTTSTTGGESSDDDGDTGGGGEMPVRMDVNKAPKCVGVFDSEGGSACLSEGDTLIAMVSHQLERLPLTGRSPGWSPGWSRPAPPRTVTLLPPGQRLVGHDVFKMAADLLTPSAASDD